MATSATYQLPVGKSGLDETRYQQLVGDYLATVTDGPILLAPRGFAKGASWRRYHRAR